MKKSEIISTLNEILNKKTIKELNEIKAFLTDKVVDTYTYTGKIAVTNDNRTPFSIADTFEDLDDLEYCLVKCKDAESVSIALCGHSRWGYSFKFELSLPNRDVFSYKDGFGNVRKVWVYKCKK